MKLVMIHGRSQGDKDPVALQQQWEGSLDKGFAGAGLSRPASLEIAFPFYGATLDDLVEQVAADTLENVVAKGGAPDTTEADFRGAFLEELARGAGITDAEIEACSTSQVTEKGPLNWEWVHSVLKALDSTPLGSRAVDLFTRDVHVYLNYGAVRRKIDAIVAAAIDGPCVVVGHSLGSVVGYNVLRRVEASLPVRRYVTVGSPLGVKAVRARIVTPLKMPDCTQTWFNAMDERDVVALRPLDPAVFAIDPAIVNRTEVANFTDNRHGIAGYLEDEGVARAVHQALTG